MIRTDILIGIIAQQGKTQKDVAIFLGMTPKTYYDKMKKGVFGSDEIEGMIEYLNIKNPMPVFFAPKVS